MSDETPMLPFARSHAFIIGINDYAHITPLKTAINDAKGIAQRLEAQHGYEVHGPLLNPKKEELEQLFFETMPNEVGEEDRVIFYFAGHGIALDGEEGPNGYIVPADAKQGDKETLIPMDALHQTLNKLPCRHGLLILDCCFSGAFKWSTGYRDLVFDLPKVIYEERFWRYVKDPAWQVITSSAYDQKAVDVISNQSIGMREEGQGNHSPFAKALFDALEGAGDVIPADQGDGVITTSELYAYLRDSVENQTSENSKSQSPSMFNLARHDKGEFIFLNPRHRFNLPPTPDRNPFMGLASYNEADNNFFFGRDRVTEALAEKVQHHSLVVVSGASGTGKSSVIKAGLLPKLRKAGWELLAVIRPGKEPMQVIEEEIGDISSKLSDDKTYVLIIDQYEELITQTLDEADRRAFEQHIADWLKSYPQLRIILSVRADFEPQFESHALAPWWQTGRYVVPAFSREEIRDIITKPALQSVLFYEPIELADKLEEDVAQAPGALPLLSFSLSELYYAYLNSGRQDRALTLDDYQALGGVIGALRTKADEAYMNQDNVHQASMRKLMLRMVSLEGGELAAKRVFTDELVFSDQAETHRIEQVATELVEARLIFRSKDTQGRIYLEPAHDALVRAWGRLWEWIKATGEEKLVWQNKLSQAVVDYHDLHESGSPKAKNLLWNNNPRLDVLRAELQGRDHSLNAKEEAFVQASVKRRKQRRRQLIGGLSGALVIFAILAVIAMIQTGVAQEQTKQAEARSLAFQANAYIDTDPSIALRLGEAAYRKDSTSTVVLQALMQAYYSPIEQNYLLYQQKVEHREAINYGEYSADGQHYLTASEDGWTKVWDLDGNVRDSMKHPFPVRRAGFSPDGSFVVSASFDTCYVWKRGASLIGKWPNQASRSKVTSVAFSPDGEAILSTSDDKRAVLWAFDQEKMTVGNIPPKLASFEGHGSTVLCADFSPDGQEILTGSADQTVRLWTRDGTLVQSYAMHRDNVFSVSFSPDGRRILSAGKDKQVYLFDKSGTRLDSFPQSGSVNFATSSPDGTEILIGTETGIARLIDQEDKTNYELLGHQGGIRSICFSPDGSEILTVSADQSARRWRKDLTQEMMRTIQSPNVRDIRLATFSPDGTEVLLAGSSEGVERIDLSSGKQTSIGEPTPGNLSLSFSKDEQQILLGTVIGMQVFGRDGQQVATIPIPEEELYDIRASTVDDVFLTVFETEVRLWNLNGDTLGLLPHDQEVLSATFAPKSGRILSVTADEYVNIWNLDGKRTDRFALADESIWHVQLSPDEQDLLALSNSYAAIRWPLDGVGDTLVLQHSNYVNTASFSPDASSQFVLTAAEDGHAILWGTAGLALHDFDARAYMKSSAAHCTVTAAQISPDGRLMLATTNQGLSFIWKTPSGIARVLRGLPLYRLPQLDLYL